MDKIGGAGVTSRLRMSCRFVEGRTCDLRRMTPAHVLPHISSSALSAKASPLFISHS